uniref:(northern house mosquito) hypothetical protein n=1 Tax=Culex pipiens TaxID=7175 RepID=A0A8D8I1J0_CULPI
MSFNRSVGPSVSPAFFFLSAAASAWSWLGCFELNVAGLPEPIACDMLPFFLGAAMVSPAVGSFLRLRFFLEMVGVSGGGVAMLGSTGGFGIVSPPLTGMRVLYEQIVQVNFAVVAFRLCMYS